MGIYFCLLLISLADSIINMNIIRGLPPFVDSNTDCSIDLEIFGMSGRLHRPSGEFASMQIGIGDDVYVITSVKQAQEAWDRIKNARHIIIQNALFDIFHLRRWITIEERPVWDLMIVEQVLWGGYYGVGEFSLADMARRYLNVRMDKSTRMDFASSSFYMTNEMLKYAADDASIALQIYHKQVEEIEKRKYDMRVYWEADEPSIWTILDMKPIKVRVKRWLEMADEFEERGRQIEDEIGVNVNSLKQVVAYINKVSRRSIANAQEATLLAIADKVPQVAPILEAKRYRKAASTYGRRWIEENVEDGDLVYSSFHVNGTETGRFSSASPNLLNIPARKIPEYRELFIQSRGRIVVADIGQQEPRCLAYLSGDKNLIKAFVDKEDIHLYVARNVFGDDTIKKGDPRREVGKMINLATSYGMTAKGLADRLMIDEAEAEKFLVAYFHRFPDVDNFIKRQRIFASSHEFVTTVMGRRVWINQHNFQWTNNAINAPIQGSSADFTKVWVNDFRKRCISGGLEFPVTMVVYDEVVMDVDKENEMRYIELLTDSFNDTASLLFPTVPFQIDVAKGKSWACKSTMEEED